MVSFGGEFIRSMLVFGFEHSQQIVSFLLVCSVAVGICSNLLIILGNEDGYLDERPADQPACCLCMYQPVGVAYCIVGIVVLCVRQMNDLI